ncbi:aminotransferase class I/II-fold pyridoxal phosphate-dependent enzyme [Candidatus Vidania fulgoroideorum]
MNKFKFRGYKIRKNFIKKGIYLDSMENNFIKSNFYKKLLKKINNNFSRYPFKNEISNSKRIIRDFYKLGKKFKITFGNGSDEIIYLLSILFFNIGSFKPSFTMYKFYSRILNKNFFEIELNNKFCINLKKTNFIIKKNKIELFFISYPNNPTGNLFDKKKILNIVKKNKKCLFVLDEAYFDFSKKTFTKYIKIFKNICILRTFSKIGFAGLRIGFLLSNKKLYKIINKVKSPYNFNILNIRLIPEILKNYNLLCVKKILNQKKKIEFLLKKKKIFFYKSFSNFILINLEKKNYKKLKLKSIFIKKTKIKNFYRVSIGNNIENYNFIKNL